MKLISLFIIPLAFLLVLFVIRLFKNNKISFQTFAIWNLIWISMALAFAFPKQINQLATMFGMNNRMFFVFTVAIVILFVIVFNIFATNKKNELTITKLAQQMSLISSEIDEMKRRIRNEGDSDDSSVQ